MVQPSHVGTKNPNPVTSIQADSKIARERTIDQSELPSVIPD